MLAKTVSFTVDGTAVRPVEVEVDVCRGLPSFGLVGLPDTAVREARERVRSAMENSGFDFPLRRITASLAPADLRKNGPGFDLALAAALSIAAGEVPPGRLEGWGLVGELALDGSVRPVRGALAMAEGAREAGLEGILVATPNGPEAALAEGITVRTIDGLSELKGSTEDDQPGSEAIPMELGIHPDGVGPDLADLRGQPGLRRALEVSAAGAHGLLMVGPPGAGKSLAARRLPSILPGLARDEALEVARIGGICGTLAPDVSRPFRAPHHTVTRAGLIGGGLPPRPGEITLAHRGVLFLDELPEFRRDVLEALREPLEVGRVEISRASGHYSMPARFVLVAAANPCPCGRGDTDPGCNCSRAAVDRYSHALSGALADRIDMTVSVAQPGFESMSGPPGEGSPGVRRRVESARRRMEARLGPGRANGDATREETAGFPVTEAALSLLGEATRSRRLSGRGHDRVLRLAMTLADLAARKAIAEEDVAVALQLRSREGVG
ncbi:MAG: YifB family Mg chelatase-like AAA ATPase [Solirubrobacterales bacterium]